MRDSSNIMINTKNQNDQPLKVTLTNPNYNHYLNSMLYQNNYNKENSYYNIYNNNYQNTKNPIPNHNQLDKMARMSSSNTFTNLNHNNDKFNNRNLDSLYHPVTISTLNQSKKSNAKMIYPQMQITQSSLNRDLQIDVDLSQIIEQIKLNIKKQIEQEQNDKKQELQERVGKLVDQVTFLSKKIIEKDEEIQSLLMSRQIKNKNNSQIQSQASPFQNNFNNFTSQNEYKQQLSSLMKQLIYKQQQFKDIKAYQQQLQREIQQMQTFQQQNKRSLEKYQEEIKQLKKRNQQLEQRNNQLFQEIDFLKDKNQVNQEKLQLQLMRNKQLEQRYYQLNKNKRSSRLSQMMRLSAVSHDHINLNQAQNSNQNAYQDILQENQGLKKQLQIIREQYKNMKEDYIKLMKKNQNDKFNNLPYCNISNDNNDKMIITDIPDNNINNNKLCSSSSLSKHSSPSLSSSSLTNSQFNNNLNPNNKKKYKIEQCGQLKEQSAIKQSLNFNNAFVNTSLQKGQQQYFAQNMDQVLRRCLLIQAISLQQML